MIGDTLAASLKQLELMSGDAEKRVVELGVKQSELSDALSGEEAKLGEAVEAVKIRQQELQAVALASFAAEDSFRQRAEDQRIGDAPVKVLSDEKTRLEAAVELHLKPVQQEELPEDAMRKHAQFLQVLAQSLSLDEALVVSVPMACSKVKSSRCAFDEMVLSTLTEGLRSRLATIDEQLLAAAPGLAARAEARAVALQGVKDTSEAQTNHAAMMKVVLEDETRLQMQLDAAKTALLTLEVQIEKAEKERFASRAAVEDFKVWPLGCFTVLKDNGSAAENAGA